MPLYPPDCATMVVMTAGCASARICMYCEASGTRLASLTPVAEMRVLEKACTKASVCVCVRVVVGMGVCHGDGVLGWPRSPYICWAHPLPSTP